MKIRANTIHLFQLIRKETRMNNMILVNELTLLNTKTLIYSKQGNDFDDIISLVKVLNFLCVREVDEILEREMRI